MSKKRCKVCDIEFSSVSEKFNHWRAVHSPFAKKPEPKADENISDVKAEVETVKMEIAADKQEAQAVKTEIENVKAEVETVKTEIKTEAIIEIKSEKVSVEPVALLRPPHVVEFKKVSKYFGEGEHKKVALQDVSFVIEDLPNVGELITIVGMSGCGKSTLLRILAGLEPHYPQSVGEIEVFGQPLRPADAGRGLVDQKYSLLPHLTVLDNVAFGLRVQGMSKAERYSLAREWISKVGLNGSEGKYPSELSGGMQQRVSIAATLILKPRIILMDEPFGALDPKTRMSMQKLLVDLWNEQESTIFFVTHQMDEAIYLGDRVFRMGTNPGRLVETLDVPRPDVSPDAFRKEKWFHPAVEELARRLETDAPANPEWFGNTIPPSQIFTHTTTKG